MWDGDDGSKDGKGPTPKQRYDIPLHNVALTKYLYIVNSSHTFSFRIFFFLKRRAMLFWG